ncbi:hypothetical protein [Lacipirellula sp.]|uniref:hypothetical protein n=1 Tax=Lacipirellula sp. TaxID=2691419 RepID=UPI003D0B9181
MCSLNSEANLLSITGACDISLRGYEYSKSMYNPSKMLLASIHATLGANVMEFEEALKAGTLLVQFGSLLVVSWGAYLATIGVNAWKRQLVGQSEYEIAKRILVLNYTLVRMAKSLRPVRRGRLPPMNDEIYRVYAEFENAIVEGRAHWGDEVVELRRPIRSYVIQILEARTKLSSGVDVSSDERRQIDNLFDMDWKSEHNHAVRKAQEAMEAFLMPCLRASTGRKTKLAAPT